MSNLPIVEPPELVGPDYSIYRFTDQIYKIIWFKSTAPRVARGHLEGRQHYDHKLDPSLSRSRRVVLELALCNYWKYFCTFTISPDNFDRADLVTWGKVFRQYILDTRKKYRKQGLEMDLPWLLVPELHSDGKTWHMHGLFGESIKPLLIPFYCERQQGKDVPDKLVEGGYFNWPEYQEKFGFCSFGLIRDHVATAFYVTKYMTKALGSLCDYLGQHVYWSARGLQRSTKHGDIYGPAPDLHKWLTHDYDFCKTGMTGVQDGLDWTFALDHMETAPLVPLLMDDDTGELALSFDAYFEAIQECIPGFER